MKKAIFGIALMLAACHAQKVGKLTPLEQETLKRINAQMDSLQREFKERAQPLIAEQTDLLTRVCGAAGFAVADCQVDIVTGAVTKKVPVPQPSKK